MLIVSVSTYYSGTSGSIVSVVANAYKKVGVQNIF